MSLATSSLGHVNGSVGVISMANFTEGMPWGFGYSSKDPITFATLNMFNNVMMSFWILIAATGVCTNALTIRAFLRMGVEDSVTVSFFALAISDFSICSMSLVNLFVSVAIILERVFRIWFYVPPLIPSFLIMAVRRIFNTTTTLITTFLAVQRCICVVFPFHVRDIFTRSRTMLFMAAIFVFSTVCATLFILSHRFEPMFNRRWNATQVGLYVAPGTDPFLVLIDIVQGIAMTSSCQVIITVCLLVMSVFLRRAAHFRQSAMSASSSSAAAATSSGGAQKTNTDTSVAGKQGGGGRGGGRGRGNTSGASSSTKETQAMVQVALLCLIFVVTNTPYLGFGIFNVVNPEFGYHGDFGISYILVLRIIFTAELINSTVNFVIYYKYNTKFRSHCFTSSKKEN